MNNLRYITIGVLHQLEKLLAVSIDHLAPKPSPGEKTNAELDAAVSGTSATWVEH